MVQAAAARRRRDSRRDAGATVQTAGATTGIRGGSGRSGFLVLLGRGCIDGEIFRGAAQESGSVAEAASGEVIDLDFDD